MSSSALHKRLAASPPASPLSSGSPPQHYHQAPGTLYSLLSLRQDNGPLGPSETNGPCWAGGGGAILRPRELNAASVPLGQARSGQDGGGSRGGHWLWRQGPGQAAGLTWPRVPRVLRAREAAAVAAGRGHGPGLPERGAPPSAPRRPVSAPAAAAGGPGPTPATPSPRRTKGQGMSGGPHSSWLCPASAYYLSTLPALPQIDSLGQPSSPSEGRRDAALCLAGSRVVACPATGSPPPGTPESLKVEWVGLEKAGYCTLLKP